MDSETVDQKSPSTVEWDDHRENRSQFMSETPSSLLPLPTRDTGSQAHSLHVREQRVCLKFEESKIREHQQESGGQPQHTQRG